MIVKEMIPPTTKRVALHTNRKINKQIEQKTLAYLTKYLNASYEELTGRLEELSREWDTERVLETNDGMLIFISSILGITTRKPPWFIITGVTGFFLAQHALQGWCLLTPIIRKLGIRTAEEINQEKIAIKYLRGDFAETTNSEEAIFQMVVKD
jgi:hypothetical protein